MNRRVAPAVGLVAILVIGALAVAALATPQVVSAQQVTERQGEPRREEPNPFLSLLPAGTEIDWDYWQVRMRREGRERRARQPALRGAPVTLTESEAVGASGDNDHPLLGEALVGVGTAPGESRRAVLDGSLLPPATPLAGFSEPDGSIPEAPPLALLPGGRVTFTGFIGDGAYGMAGTGSGDFDAVAFAGRARQLLTIQVRATTAVPRLDPAFLILDSSGGGIAFADDTVRGGFFSSSDAEMEVILPYDDTYYLILGGQDYNVGLGMQDFFDAGSGLGATSEGGYEVIFGEEVALYPDADYFTFELRAGDVIGAVADGGPLRLGLAEATGEILVSSRFDLSAIYPPSSPLPGGGEAAIAYVIDHDGTYAVGVSSMSPFAAGTYSVEIGVLRPPLAAGAAGTHQSLFLDFDGAAVERGDFGVSPEVVALSPLVSFLDDWGLGPGDESALIDEIVDTVRENLQLDVMIRGANGDFLNFHVPGQFFIEIRNSRDHPDPGADLYTSRVVIGGTIDELRLNTIGIAQDVDPGNISAAGTAVVLLDLLSGPASDGNSLNGVPLAAGTDIRSLVGRAIGNVASHEAGHLFGNFHTDRDEGLHTIMDRGGRLFNILGVGEDEVFGTADDRDVDLEGDRYSPAEAFQGIEETLEVVSFGLPAAGARSRLFFAPLEVDFGPLALGDAAERTVLLSNGGSLPLEIMGARLDGGVDFTFAGGTGVGTLAAGESRPLVLRFAPAAAGARSASLHLASGDPERPTVEIPLLGIGGLPGAAVDRLAHDFGALTYGAASIRASTTFEVRSTGGVAMTYTSVLAGGRPELFAIDDGGSGLLAAGGRRSIAVSFRPGGVVGEARARLLIATDDPARPGFAVELVGRADGPDLEVFPPSSPYSFGALALTMTGSRAFQLINAGTRPLTLGEALLTEDGEGTMRITELPRLQNLAPGASDSVTVVFEPASRGLFSGVLVVASSDPDEPRREVPMVGFAARPELAVDPVRVILAAAEPGSIVSRTITFTNVDPAFTLRVDSSLTGSPRFSLDDASRFFLDPGDSATRTVSYVTAEPGVVEEGELTLTTNDPVAPTTVVPLIGQSLSAVPVLTVSRLLALGVLLAVAGLGCLRRL